MANATTPKVSASNTFLSLPGLAVLKRKRKNAADTRTAQRGRQPCCGYPNSAIDSTNRTRSTCREIGSFRLCVIDSLPNVRTLRSGEGLRPIDPRTEIRRAASVQTPRSMRPSPGRARAGHDGPAVRDHEAAGERPPRRPARQPRRRRLYGARTRPRRRDGDGRRRADALPGAAARREARQGVRRGMHLPLARCAMWHIEWAGSWRLTSHEPAPTAGVSSPFDTRGTLFCLSSGSPIITATRPAGLSRRGGGWR